MQHPKSFTDGRPAEKPIIVLALLAPKSRRTGVLVVPPTGEFLHCYVTQMVWNSGPLGKSRGGDEHYLVSRQVAEKLIKDGFVANRPDCDTGESRDGRYWITNEGRSYLEAVRRGADQARG